MDVCLCALCKVGLAGGVVERLLSVRTMCSGCVDVIFFAPKPGACPVRLVVHQSTAPFLASACVSVVLVGGVRRSREA